MDPDEDTIMEPIDREQISESVRRAISSGDLDMVKQTLRDYKLCPEAGQLEWNWLCKAICLRKTDIVEYLISKGFKLTYHGVPLDSRLGEKWTNALELAMIHYHPKLFELLLLSGSPVNHKVSGETLLHRNVRNESVHFTKLFLKGGADCNIPNRLGQTPLHTAVEINSKELVRLLIDGGSDINVGDVNGRTALHLAIGLQHWEIFAILNTCKPNIDGTLLAKGLSFESMIYMRDIISKLDRLGIKMPLFSGDSNNALLGAIRGKNLKDLQTLLEDSQMLDLVRNTSGQGQITPLHIAAFYRTEDGAKLLIRSGANLLVKDAHGDTPVDYVMKNCDDHMARLFLAERKNLKHEILVSAILHNRKGFVKPALLSLAPIKDVTLRLRRSQSFLYGACRMGQHDLIKQLLKNGADPNMKFGNGTLLHHLPNNPVAVRLLIDWGADINAFDEHWKTLITKCFDPPASPERRPMLIRHMIKLEAAGLYVCNENVEHWSRRPSGYGEFEAKCKKAVEKLKAAKIANFPISMYDILTGTVNRLAKLAGNENLFQTAENLLEKTKGWEYHEMIRAKFNCGKLRRKFILEGQKSLQVIFPGLPIICIDDILLYLSNEDISNLCLISNSDGCQ